ncbi:MAG TPA: hypothetical protein VIM96_09470 [Pseudomonadales bacterium]
MEFSASIQRSSKSSDPLLEVTYRKMAGERLHYQLYAIEKELGGVYPGRDQILEHLTFSEAETNSSSCRELRDLWGDLANMDIQKEWSLAPADQQRPNEILVWPHAPIWQIAYFSENSTIFIETSDSENQIAAWIERTIEMLSGCIEKSSNQSNKALASRAGRG